VTKTYQCHKFRNCDIVTFGNVAKCHTFSNLWFKATFTFYVWIQLGTALRDTSQIRVQAHIKSVPKKRSARTRVTVMVYSYVVNRVLTTRLLVQ